MKQFRFRLQSIRELRHRAVAAKHIEHAVAKDALQKAAETLKCLEDRRDAILASEKDARKDRKSQSLAELRRLASHINTFDDDIVRQSLIVKESEKKLAAQLEELLEAQKEKKVMDKLYEQQRRRFQASRKRKEQIEMDELAKNVRESRIQHEGIE